MVYLGNQKQKNCRALWQVKKLGEMHMGHCLYELAKGILSAVKACLYRDSQCSGISVNAPGPRCFFLLSRLLVLSLFITSPGKQEWEGKGEERQAVCFVGD